MKRYDPVGHKRQLVDQAYCLIANASELKKKRLQEENPDPKALETLEADLKTMRDLALTLGTQLTQEDVAAIEETLNAFDDTYGTL